MTVLCSLEFTHQHSPETITSEYEQQCGPCELLLDLDGDGSSGAGGYDYLSPDTVSCLHNEGARIADEDVFIAKDAPIDFMTLEILSPHPGEYLDLIGSVTGLTVSGQGSESLLVQNSAGLDYEAFVELLQLVRYYYDSPDMQGGIRQVEVQFTTVGGRESNFAYGLIEVLELEFELDLGEYISICEGGSLVLDPDINEPGADFIWSTGENSPTIEVQESGHYSVTVTANDFCPTIGEVEVEVLPIALISLSGPTNVCEFEWIELTVTFDADYTFNFTIVDESGIVITEEENVAGGSFVFPFQAGENNVYSLSNISSPDNICIDSTQNSVEITVGETYIIDTEETICDNQTVTFNGMEVNEEGFYSANLSTQLGCDSFVFLDLKVLPTYLQSDLVFSCNPNDQDSFTQHLQTQDGCDSIIVTGTAYLPPDSTFLTSFTCDPDQVDLLIDTLVNEFGCDSLVFTGVQYLPPDTTSLVLYTCHPDEEGSSTDTLTNTHGCDSLVFVQVNYVPPDTLLSIEYTCVESEAEYIEEQYTNQWGCDSLVISVVEYIPPDSTFIQLSSCDPEDEGVFTDTLTNTFGCDSLVITTVNFFLSDSTFLTAYTCEAGEEGMVIDSFQNQQGCDSLVFTQVIYSPPDTVYVFDSSCDPELEGITGTTLQNSLGCDSLVILQVDLLPSDSVFIEQTTCDPGQAGTQVSHYTNQYGCDSTVVVEVELLPSDEIHLYETTCDPQQAGTFTETYVNQYGCDSVVVTEISLLPSDTTYLMFADCEAGQRDTTAQVLENQHGCDSLVLSITVPVDPPEVELLSVGDYNGYDISCAGASDGSLRALVEEGIPPYQLVWEDGSTGYDRDQLSEGKYSLTVTDDNDCTAADSIHLSAPDSLRMELLVTHPDCFDDQTGGIEITVVGGVPPYEYRINSGSYQEQSAFPGLGPGVFELSLRDANGCVQNDIVIIQSPEELEVSLGEDREVVPGDSVLLELITNVPYDSLSQIDWKGLQDPDCEDCPIVYDRPVVSTTYSVTITDKDGCMATDEMTVTVDQDRNIYIPNAFSPNGDGVNDFFRPYFSSGAERVKRFEIFDRWGNKVFSRLDVQSDHPTLSWDGTHNGQPMNPDVFVFVLQVEYRDGYTTTLSGNFLLLR